MRGNTVPGYIRLSNLVIFQVFHPLSNILRITLMQVHITQLLSAVEYFSTHEGGLKPKALRLRHL